MRDAGLVLVAEEFLSRQVAAAPHQRGHAVVAHGELVPHAALAGKAQQQRVALHLHVPRQQAAQAVGAVAARVLAMTDAHPGAIEQPHQRRQHPLAIEAAIAQTALHLATQPRQAMTEIQQQAKLVLAPQRHPVGVIAVLLASARVARRGLDVSVVAGTDPDIHIGRRDGQRADAPQRGLVPHRTSVRVDIPEAAGRAHAAQPRLIVTDPAQSHRLVLLPSPGRAHAGPRQR